MPTPLFVVPIADLERGARTVSWVIPVNWLTETLRDSDATPLAPGELEVEISKNGRDVMVRGRASVQVSMACVVTLDPLTIDLTPDVFLLLSPGPSSPPARRSGGPGTRRSATKEAADKPQAAGAKSLGLGKARTKGASAMWTADPELGLEDVAKDTYDGEKIVLDGFVREFILLELPMYPRRSDLPLDQTAAIGAPSVSSGEQPAPVDPRLLPLAELASRLRDQKKE